MKRQPLVQRVLQVATAGLVLLLSACSLNLPPVRVDGSPMDLEQLVGEWVGEYTSDDPLGRSGSIVFILVEGQNFAHGDVLMQPRGSQIPYTRHPPEHVTAGRTLAVPESLSILFVRAEDGVLIGELDPYWDPDRHCIAHTTFRGVMGRDRIRGTYVTTFASGGPAATGKWQAGKTR